MEENKNEKEQKKTPIGTLVLMAIGFIVGGITTAATASEIPNAVKTVGEKLVRAVPEEEKSTETTE
jgi:hypothetical protein